jgi:hypothetical protein
MEKIDNSTQALATRSTDRFSKSRAVAAWQPARAETASYVEDQRCDHAATETIARLDVNQIGEVTHVINDS